MYRIIVFLSIFVFMNNLVEANQFSFDFKKSLFLNKYNLIISNEDPKRAIEFYGCYNYPPTETNYYVLMKNDTKYNFDSKIFCQIGMKGRYWINAGKKGVIPFNIKKNIMQNAKQIVFKGVTYIPVTTGVFVDSTDMRDLTIVYDVESDSILFEIGKLVLKQPGSDEIRTKFDVFGDADTAIDNVNNIYNQGIKVEEYRLRRLR